MSMTENEAIGQLKYMYKTCMNEKCKHKGQCDLCCESKDMAIQALEEIQQYRAIGTVKQFEWCKDASHWKELFKDKLEQYEAIGTVEEIKSYFNDNRKAGYKHGYSDGYAKAIDEFAERLKEMLKGMQMVELQGEDVCPCSESGEECPYINQDIGCQYCAREHTIKDIDEIAEQMKGEQNERLQ